MKTTNMDELIIKTEESDGQIIFTMQSEVLRLHCKKYNEENQHIRGRGRGDQAFDRIVNYIAKKTGEDLQDVFEVMDISQIGPEELNTFEVEIEKSPKVEIKNYKNLGVVLPKSFDLSVSRRDMEFWIDAQVSNFLSEYRVLKEPQVIAWGDWVQPTFEIDVAHYLTVTIPVFAFRIGNGNFMHDYIDQKTSLDIEEKMLGWDMSTGEKDITITFPNNTKQKHLAGWKCRIIFNSVKVFTNINGIDQETLIKEIVKVPLISPQDILNVYEFMSFVKEEIIFEKICDGFSMLKDAILANVKYNEPISERTIQKYIKHKECWDFGNRESQEPHIEAKKEIIFRSALRYIIDKEDLVNKVSNEAIEKEYARRRCSFFKESFDEVKSLLITSCAKKMAMELLVKSHLR